MTALVRPYEAAFARRVSAPIAWTELAVMAAAFVLQVPLVLNADLGWLLTVCEKMLAGGKLGVDVIELNPPLSVLMYMPAAYLGSVLPVPAHVFVIAMVLLLAWWSTRLTLDALGPLIADAEARRRARLILLTVLALVPGATFGQREHFAVLGLVPFVALAASGAMQAGPRALALKLLVGFGAGFAMCIKPHFALPASLPLLWAAYQRRSLRPLLGVECWTAAAVVVLYFGAAFLAYPEYFSVYPRWAALTYLPLRVPMRFLFASSELYCAIALAWMLHATCGRDPAKWSGTVPWLLAMVGGLASYVIQGKGYAYMRLPAASFGLLAVLLNPAFLRAPSWASEHRARNGMIAVAALAMVFWLIPGPNSFIALQEPIRAAAPSHPSMLTVGANVGLSEPLVRKLDGKWVSAAGSQLLSGGAISQLQTGRLGPEDKLLADQIIAMERTRLRNDLQVRRPDVLLIDIELQGQYYDWEAWARTDPAISRELDRHYRFLTRKQGVAIWLRRQGNGSGEQRTSGF